jgi:hypothetical protein
MTCAERKQNKNRQSKKDSGNNAPIDGAGRVICSDLKAPITPVDHEQKHYLVNFIDHHTNYCRIFLAKTKNKRPAKKLNFVGHGEYANIDLFCERTGIAR